MRYIMFKSLQTRTPTAHYNDLIIYFKKELKDNQAWIKLKGENTVVSDSLWRTS